MKTITSLTAAAVLILGTLPAAADPETEGKETRSDKASAHLFEELGLSEEQKSKVEEIMEAQKESRQMLFAEHRENPREARKQMKALREETDGELREVLSEKQFERFQELRKERWDRRGRRGGDRQMSEGEGDHESKGKHKRGRGRSHH
jgi:Spy/CpxP family protein refolding chaperone